MEPALAQAWVRADADRLQQALLNLLSNAARFVPDDGHGAVRVEVTAAPDGKGVRVALSDMAPACRRRSVR